MFAGKRQCQNNQYCLGFGNPIKSRGLKMAATGEETDGRPSWLVRKIRGLLLDISGVLYNGSEEGGEVIPGSVEAVEK